MDHAWDLPMQSVLTRYVLACEVSQPAHGVANKVCEKMMTLLVGSRTADPERHLDTRADWLY